MPLDHTIRTQTIFKCDCNEQLWHASRNKNNKRRLEMWCAVKTLFPDEKMHLKTAIVKTSSCGGKMNSEA